MYRGSSHVPKLRIRKSEVRSQGSDWVSARPARSFEELDVFQRAYRLSLDIHRFSLTLPPIEQRALGDQLRRASKSVCANLAEGFGRQSASQVEFRRFVLMVLGSADEMRLWCRYCLDLGHVDDAVWRQWRDAYQEVARMLQGLRTKAGRRSRPPDP